jgi:pyridinium-3,5-bisthiocarboxylic acid mononucleotide nickel chelatase
MTKIAYFDCIAGASGDMILGAMVDAGLPIETLRARLDALHLEDFELKARRVAKNAFAATKVDVIIADDVPERHLGDILEIVENSDLDEVIVAQAVAIFEKIGRAEAGIHGTSLDHVHLHELGGVDTIVDVVGALVGLDALGVERVLASPLPLGRGFIKGAHGQIPLPAPATVAILEGVPVVGSPLEVETVTPTGAALLASLAEDFGPLPPMTLEAVGYGAGSRDLPVPNVIRLFIGELTEGRRRAHAHAPGHGHNHDHGHDHGHTHPHPHPHEREAHAPDHDHPHPNATEEDTAEHVHDHAHGPVIDIRHNHPHDHPHSDNDTHSCLDVDQLKVLETNIDDLNPESYGYIMDKLFDAGALDVFFIPIQMKKNRPATLLRVLCMPQDVEAMTAILFRETSTLGIREQTVDRHALPRRVEPVPTPYGEIHVKVATLPDGSLKIAPEYEDCRHLAEQHDAPLREVYQVALEAARHTFESTTTVPEECEACP